MIWVGEVVEFDHVLFAKRTKGDGALIELAAKKRPPLIGIVTAVMGDFIDVTWEDGRQVRYGPESPRYPGISQTDLLREAME